MKKGTKKLFFGTIALLLMIWNPCSINAQGELSAVKTDGISISGIKQIEVFIHERMKSAKIPGLALVIVKDNQPVYEKGFGYADLETKSPVTPNTLFELGSTTETFTALGILRLKEQGLLRLTDSVDRFLPWFYMKYRGHRAKITIEQLLYQTSGISFPSITTIPVSADSSLEDTIKALVGKELNSSPGQDFFYTTLNYDILGFIIQQISGQSFEQYMEANVLQPLKLDHSFFLQPESKNNQFMAVGYKNGFMRSFKYNAPRYRGNIPAGYLVSNADDIGIWIKDLLNPDEYLPWKRALFEQARTPDYSVKPMADGSYGAMGWMVNPIGATVISKGGANPGFSSYIELRPSDKLGIALLTNRGDMDTVGIQSIGKGVMALLRGDHPNPVSANTNQNIDDIATFIIWISTVFILITLGFIAYSLLQALKGQRRFKGDGLKWLWNSVLAIVMMIGFGYCLYRVPDIIFPGFDWGFITVWGPASIVIAIVSIFSAVFLFGIYGLFISWFPKPEEKSYFLISVLSIVSGLGNAFLIFTVTAALNAKPGSFPVALFLYFLLAIVIYAFGTRWVRTKMLILTNHIVYQKRIQLLDKILASSYQNLEMLEGGKIHAGLNNDTEVISNFATWIIDGLTSLITLICCFVFLGFLNIYAVLTSIFVFLVAAGLYFYVGKAAHRLWEQTRDIQNVFFRFINDLIYGFKELSLHEKKRFDFAGDMKVTCETYRDKRVAGEVKYINVFVIGELLFVFLIAVVVFAFPILFPAMDRLYLSSYVFIFLYMIGPVLRLLRIIPDFIRFRISWERINGLIKDLSVSATETSKESPGINPVDNPLLIQLKNVIFQYKNETGEQFTVGPIHCEFRSGEITFITGGNGSGKSTFVKLLTGLYTPDQGEIIINGIKTESKSLGNFYSAVFSDVYLFEKMYGIEYQSKGNEIDQYLKILRMEHKLQINDGVFSTIQLSTGQRKRLALLLSYLEDRAVFLFDEWAADQDAQFREYFYLTLLPELRKRGKCIIAITHDDRYFSIADQIIKMDMGKIVT